MYPKTGFLSLSVMALLLFSGIAFAGQPNVDALYTSARRDMHSLFSSPARMKERHNWEDVISRFRHIVKTRPTSPRAGDSLFNVGLLYKNMYQRFHNVDDKKNAVEAFNNLIVNHPNCSFVAEARKNIGDIRFTDKDDAKAAKEYKTAVKRSITPKTDDASAKQTPSPAAQRDIATLLGIRRYSNEGYTRLVLDLSDHTAYRVERTSNPDRLMIDLLDTKTGDKVSSVLKYDSGMARAVRISRNAGVTRIVLDLTEKNSTHKVLALKQPFRVVIDIGRSRPAPPVTPQKQTEAKTKQNNEPNTDVRIPVASSAGAIRTIVIDAGHGGKDPGAIGPSGLREKDVVLAIAKNLKTELERRLPNCKVLMTRKSDVFWELDQRTVYANSKDADLFISIHANSSPNSSAHGLETYFLSPARSKDELETAARENMLALHSSNETENDIAYIMSDMSNTSKVNESSNLAGAVQRTTVGGLRSTYSSVGDKGVKQAMFYVLWRATMPSILVEAGFISNPEEERRLANPAYQVALAGSIADGVVKYTKTYTVAVSQ